LETGIGANPVVCGGTIEGIECRRGVDEPIPRNRANIGDRLLRFSGNALLPKFAPVNSRHWASLRANAPDKNTAIDPEQLPAHRLAFRDAAEWLPS